MAQLKIIKADGSESTHQITPSVEFAFENYAKMGLHRAFRELEMQTHVYWIAWFCLQKAGEVVKPFGQEFLDTLTRVEVLDDDPLV
jgi:hypothetical protein